MLLLATATHRQLRRYRHPNLGRLLTPRSRDCVADSLRDGTHVAADNDCFQGLDCRAFLRLVDAIRVARAELSPSSFERFRWLAVPDVVGDADATLDRFRAWHPELADVPLAFVLQDGCHRPGRVPWTASGLRGVFIGGTDTFKYSPELRMVVSTARARGLAVHIGRCNSRERIAYSASIGCHTFDGSGWSTWRRANLSRGLRFAGQF